MFVRWLGAFRAGVDSQSIDWEISQTAREVAVEPLFKGRSFLLAENRRVWLGIIADESGFNRGFIGDCWSEPGKDGTLAPKRKMRPIRNCDQFRKAFRASKTTGHGEAFFDFLTVKAIAIRFDCQEWQFEHAKAQAKRLGVPLIRIQEVDM